ncbi:acyltransferase family protein [Streptomyces sp. NPDC021093]|uniref:acyltransferase family protein n=1 Tax=Streptomyces sp. NPDC021093 TaxID=3365112 RepID=UPI0037930DBA
MTDLRVPPRPSPTRSSAVRVTAVRPTQDPGRGRAAHPRPPVPGRPLRFRRVHEAVLRIDAATPADRDRAVDVLRVLAITGVVLGHWLVSGVVLQAGGHLAGDSPLAHMPALAPLTWLLQPLALFFFVGGRVAARSYASAHAVGTPYRTWLGRRLTRLLRPVVPLAVTWAMAWAGLVATGIAHETIHTMMWLVFSPLWFLGVYAALTACTPLVHRHGVRTAVAAGLLVAALDGAHALFGDDGVAGTVRQLNVPAAWLIPYALGAAWSAGSFARRRTGAALLIGGACATAALVLWCGYPASMVGVPGSVISNLSPPTVAAVAFGLAQCGGALLLCGPLRRLVGQRSGTGASQLPDLGDRRARPAHFLWAGVVLLSMSALTVFLWHQTAMLTTTLVTLGLGAFLPGLHTSPDGPAWVLLRLAWIPIFGAVLLAFRTLFQSYERPRRKPVQGTISI